MVIREGSRAKKMSIVNMPTGISNSMNGGGGRGGNIKGRNNNKAAHKKRTSKDVMLK